MAQPSVACYFSTRKRSAVENNKINQARKVLILDSDEIKSVNNNGEDCYPHDDKRVIVNLLEGVGVEKDLTISESKLSEKTIGETLLQSIKVPGNSLINSPKVVKKPVRTLKSKNTKNDSHQKSLDDFIGKMSNKLAVEKIQEYEQSTKVESTESDSEKSKGSTDVNLDDVKKKISRSARLAELKASIARFKKSDKKLAEIEKKTSQITSPKLQNFKTIQLEVEQSPTKLLSPEKAYLSPRKDQSVRKNLLGLLSPTKNAIALATSSPSKRILEATSKPALTLPFKYRFLAEIYRAIDTVCQILYNRKETITFKKLKPAVEEMLKRNLTEKHLAQIKSIYPDAFTFTQEKLRTYGTGNRQEDWELVLKPLVDDKEHMTSETLLQRRRKLFDILIRKVKDYHDEFLLSLIPPMHIRKDEVTRWHPEFDIEKVPDIELAELPQPPFEERFKTGKEVLEKAREMFNCNTRMEQALERLKAAKEANPALDSPPKEPISVLKGIPKALLEKVRQKQAAKALVSMTRSADKEKEVLVYSRLPEIARITKNIFVTEKKNVLLLDTVIAKLENCYRCHLTKTEMEQHLRTISKESDGWLIFHHIRNSVYVKLVKNTDLSLIVSKLETLAKQKSES